MVYRVSDEAVLVLAKTIPIDILADEMKRLYFRRPECLGQTAAKKAEEQRTSMHKWQSRSESSLKVIWTFDLVPDVTSWMENKHCKLNYYVTQILTDRGCFRKYLPRFEHDTSSVCPNCVDEEEDVLLILTFCPRFRWPAGTNLGPNWLMEEMFYSRTPRSQYSQNMAEIMMEVRRLEERKRNLR